MDGMGRIVSIRSGRDWSDWSAELRSVTLLICKSHNLQAAWCYTPLISRVVGDELKWKFNSDGSVNGWGWRFTVYPIMPAAGPQNMQGHHSVTVGQFFVENTL